MDRVRYQVGWIRVESGLHSRTVLNFVSEIYSHTRPTEIVLLENVHR